MDSLHPNNSLYYLISRVSLSLNAVLKRNLSKAGFSYVKPAYIAILLWLWMDDGMGTMLGKFGKDEGIKLNDLGKLAGLEPSSMTGLIDRMEKDGLVVRVSDPKDRRATNIQLTQKGINVKKHILAIMDTVTKEIIATIPKKHEFMTMDVLRKILMNINNLE